MTEILALLRDDKTKSPRAGESPEPAASHHGHLLRAHARVCLSVCVSVRPSVWFVCLSVCLGCLSVCLSVASGRALIQSGRRVGARGGGPRRGSVIGREERGRHACEEVRVGKREALLLLRGGRERRGEGLRCIGEGRERVRV